MSSVFEAQPMDSSAAFQPDVDTTCHEAVYILFLEECQDWACMYDPHLKEVLEGLECFLRESDAGTMDMDISSPEESNQEASDDSLDVNNNTPSPSETFYRPNNFSKLTRPVLASAIKYAHSLDGVRSQDDFVERMKVKVPKCPEWALREIFEGLPLSFKISRKERKNKRRSE